VVDFTSNKPYRHSRDNGECPKDYYKYWMNHCYKYLQKILFFNLVVLQHKRLYISGSFLGNPCGTCGKYGEIFFSE
jgi:hypothetical protein